MPNKTPTKKKTTTSKSKATKSTNTKTKQSSTKKSSTNKVKTNVKTEKKAKTTTKAKKEKKVVKETKKSSTSSKTTLEKNIKKLITKGKKRGYITQSEILEFFPYAEDDLDTLDMLYEKLLDAGVEVFDVESEVDASKFSADKVDLTKLGTIRSPSIDPVKMYLKEIGKSNLLTAEEEADLAQKVEALRYTRVVENFQKENPGKKPSTEYLLEHMGLEEHPEILADIKKYAKNENRKEWEAAEKKLTESNLRLVVSIAKRYLNRGLTFLDLIQEGNLGLMKAVEKFDWRRGYKFSTYATWWIRQAITRAIADQARVIRIPVHMIETINKYTKVVRELEQKYERPPKPEEIAKAMDIDVEKAKGIVKIRQETASLEKTVGREDDSTLKEFIEDTSIKSPYDSASHELLKGHIDDVLETLNDRERRVLELRFGLKDGRTRTLEEVGKEFGVTRERIRQIEAKALRKLRHPSRSKRLKDYLD